MENEKVICCPYGDGMGKKWSAGDDVIYTTMCYDLSVAKLSDFDKPKFVRWHAGIE